ncbi:MAG: DUF1778 domain-containing protein [Phycisphaerae bacterium]
MTTASSSSRLAVRLDPELKDLIERAAAVLGQTISSFAVSTLTTEARKVVEEHEIIRLSNRDRDRILALLDNPPAPSERLRRAMKRHSEAVRK